MPRIRWIEAPDRREEARALSRAEGIHPVLAHILINRGVQPGGLARFLLPDRESSHHPRLLPDMEPAAERFALAVSEQQKVCIYGDFDADGSCAGALLSRFLTRRRVPFAYYVPDRFDEGYGVNAAALLRILTAQKPALVVTVDCGITAAEELDTARALGTDVIVTDHHQPGARLPAVPTVDPHRAESTYPFREICGTTVAYKLCLAAAERLGEDLQAVEDELLELVAVATVADVMPLTDENRWFVAEGLSRMAREPSVGIEALLKTAGLGGNGALTVRDISFGIGPRLNAAGRMDTATNAYRLLCTEDRHEAYELAQHLEQLNHERRELEGRISDEAAAMVQAVSLHETWGLVVDSEGWHEGVSGLVAGRLCNRHHRPALAISRQGDTARGSGRSIAACDLHGALTACEDLLLGFGGHPRAAGFRMDAAKIAPLRERFNEVVRARLTDEDLLPSLTTECAVKGHAATLELARELARLAPFGEGNPEPVLEIRGLRLDNVRPTRDGVHLQIGFLTEAGGGVKGFWPRQGALHSRLEAGAEVEVAGHLQVDSWQGRDGVQVIVQDLRYPRGQGGG